MDLLECGGNSSSESSSSSRVVSPTSSMIPPPTSLLQGMAGVVGAAQEINQDGRSPALSPCKRKESRGMAYTIRSCGFQVTLDNREVWERFHSWGTEMILTKAGRRMFPYCRYKIRGLDPQSCYLMAIDVVPVDGHRYRWGDGCWMPIERGRPQIPDSVYVHQEGVAPGSFWMYESISFSEVKLTNTALGQDGVISLVPMFKYVTRFHIIRANKVPRHLRLDADNVHTFIFPQTEFFAVTAYQNTAITHLKISHSPLAWSTEPKPDVLNQDEEGGGDGSGLALNSQQGVRERVSLGSSGKRDHACMVGTNDLSYDASRGDGSVGMLEEDVLSDKSTNGDGVIRNKLKRDDNSNGCKDQNTLFDISKVKDEPNDTWQELVENVDPPSSLGGKGESQGVLQNIPLSDCLLPAGNSTCKSNLISKVESARAGAMIVPTSVEQGKDPKCPTSHLLNQNLFPVVRLKQCNISKPTVKLGELPSSVLYSYSIPQISLSRSACGDRPLIVLVSESPPHWSEPTDDVKPSKLCLSEALKIGHTGFSSWVWTPPKEGNAPAFQLPPPSFSSVSSRSGSLCSRSRTPSPTPGSSQPRGRRAAPRGLAWEAPTQRADAAAATATHHNPRTEPQADRVDVGGVSFFSFSNKEAMLAHRNMEQEKLETLRLSPTLSDNSAEHGKKTHLLNTMFNINVAFQSSPTRLSIVSALLCISVCLNLFSVGLLLIINCSGADPRFVSRTGKTNDVTKIKGWQHKFGLQTPVSSSGSADMNTLGKNRSVFLSDKLDEYLQEEEKLLEQRPNMYASKAAGVTFQTPRTGSTYVRTLDSVLRRRAGPARSAGEREAFAQTCTTSPPPPPLPLSGVTQKRGALAGRGKISTAALRATQKSFKRGTRGKRCSRGGKYGSRGGKYGGRAEVVATATPLASPKKVTLPSSPPLTPPLLKPARSCAVSGAALVKNANSRNVNTMLLALEEMALLDGKHRTYITTDRAERSITTLLTPQVGTSSSPSSTPAASSRCQKEFCRLGCVCDSLGEGRAEPAHCGKPECMLECSCPPQARHQAGLSMSKQSGITDGTEPEDESFGRHKRRKRLPTRLSGTHVFYDDVASDCYAFWKLTGRKGHKRKLEGLGTAPSSLIQCMHVHILAPPKALFIPMSVSLLKSYQPPGRNLGALLIPVRTRRCIIYIIRASFMALMLSMTATHHGIIPKEEKLEIQSSSLPKASKKVTTGSSSSGGALCPPVPPIQTGSVGFVQANALSPLTVAWNVVPPITPAITPLKQQMHPSGLPQSKLIEIVSNCNWEAERTRVLSAIAEYSGGQSSGDVTTVQLGDLQLEISHLDNKERFKEKRDPSMTVSYLSGLPSHMCCSRVKIINNPKLSSASSPSKQRAACLTVHGRSLLQVNGNFMPQAKLVVGQMGALQAMGPAEKQQSMVPKGNLTLRGHSPFLQVNGNMVTHTKLLVGQMGSLQAIGQSVGPSPFVSTVGNPSPGTNLAFHAATRLVTTPLSPVSITLPDGTMAMPTSGNKPVTHLIMNKVGTLVAGQPFPKSIKLGPSSATSTHVASGAATAAAPGASGATLAAIVPEATNGPVATAGLVAADGPVSTGGLVTADCPVASGGPVTANRLPTADQPVTDDGPVSAGGLLTACGPASAADAVVACGPVADGEPVGTSGPVAASRSLAAGRLVATGEPEAAVKSAASGETTADDKDSSSTTASLTRAVTTSASAGVPIAVPITSSSPAVAVNLSGGLQLPTGMSMHLREVSLADPQRLVLIPMQPPQVRPLANPTANNPIRLPTPAPMLLPGQRMVLQPVKASSGMQLYRHPSGQLVQLVPVRSTRPRHPVSTTADAPKPPSTYTTLRTASFSAPKGAEVATLEASKSSPVKVSQPPADNVTKSTVTPSSEAVSKQTAEKVLSGGPMTALEMCLVEATKNLEIKREKELWKERLRKLDMEMSKEAKVSPEEICRPIKVEVKLENPVPMSPQAMPDEEDSVSNKSGSGNTAARETAQSMDDESTEMSSDEDSEVDVENLVSVHHKKEDVIIRKLEYICAKHRIKEKLKLTSPKDPEEDIKTYILPCNQPLRGRPRKIAPKPSSAGNRQQESSQLDSEEQPLSPQERILPPPPPLQSQPKQQTKPHSQSETESYSQPQAPYESQLRPSLNGRAQTKSEFEQQPDDQLQLQPQSESQPEAQSKSPLHSRSESQQEPELQSQLQPQIHCEPQPQLQPQLVSHLLPLKRQLKACASGNEDTAATTASAPTTIPAAPPLKSSVVSQATKKPSVARSRPLILTRKRPYAVEAHESPTTTTTVTKWTTVSSNAATRRDSPIHVTSDGLLMTSHGQVLTLKGKMLPSHSNASGAQIIMTQGVLQGKPLAPKGHDKVGAGAPGIASVTIRLQCVNVPTSGVSTVTQALEYRNSCCDTTSSTVTSTSSRPVPSLLSGSPVCSQAAVESGASVATVDEAQVSESPEGAPADGSSWAASKEVPDGKSSTDLMETTETAGQDEVEDPDSDLFKIVSVTSLAVEQSNECRTKGDEVPPLKDGIANNASVADNNTPCETVSVDSVGSLASVMSPDADDTHQDNADTSMSDADTESPVAVSPTHSYKGSTVNPSPPSPPVPLEPLTLSTSTRGDNLSKDHPSSCTPASTRTLPTNNSSHALLSHRPTRLPSMFLASGCINAASAMGTIPCSVRLPTLSLSQQTTLALQAAARCLPDPPSKPTATTGPPASLSSLQVKVSSTVPATVTTTTAAVVVADGEESPGPLSPGAQATTHSLGATTGKKPALRPMPQLLQMQQSKVPRVTSRTPRSLPPLSRVAKPPSPLGGDESPGEQSCLD
ncbi:unnamed protein product [Lampetra planeri]